MNKKHKRVLSSCLWYFDSSIDDGIISFLENPSEFMRKLIIQINNK